jgi:hypothetical protein
MALRNMLAGDGGMGALRGCAVGVPGSSVQRAKQPGGRWQGSCACAGIRRAMHHLRQIQLLRR